MLLAAARGLQKSCERVVVEYVLFVPKSVFAHSTTRLRLAPRPLTAKAHTARSGSREPPPRVQPVPRPLHVLPQRLYPILLQQCAHRRLAVGRA